MACVSIPHLPLQLCLRAHPDWREHPVVVIDADKPSGLVLWSNTKARACQILPGLRFGTALSLCHELRAGVVSQGEIDAAMTKLTALLFDFCPIIEPSREEPGIFWLDASGLTSLYSSLAVWAERLRQRLKTEESLASHVTVGWTRFGVYALAKAEHHGVLDSKSQEQQLTAEVKLRVLAVAPVVRDTLAKLGVHTVGELLALPASGLRERFGDEIYRFHAMARDALWMPMRPQPPPAPLREHIELDEPEVDSTRLLFLIKSRLHPLLVTLAEKAQALSSIEIGLLGAAARQEVCHLRPAAPTLDAVQILELVRLRLESAPSFPVTKLEIEVIGTPTEPQQAKLFARSKGYDEQALARALARLRAELGEQSVVRAVLTDAHLPEAQFRFEPLHTLPAAPKVEVAPRSLVVRFLSKPVLLPPRPRDLRNRGWVPIGLPAGPVVDMHGPDIRRHGWWLHEAVRHYYFVSLHNGRVIWAFFDAQRQQWFLQGEVE